MAFVGGAVPPPLAEVTVNDREFAPATVRARAGQSVRYKVASGGELNHIITVGDESSPLLRPGTSWIVKVDSLGPGSHKVVCEVTCMRGLIDVLPGEVRKADTETAAEDTGAAEEIEDEADEEDPGTVLGLANVAKKVPIRPVEDKRLKFCETEDIQQSSPAAQW